MKAKKREGLKASQDNIRAKVAPSAAVGVSLMSSFRDLQGQFMAHVGMNSFQPGARVQSSDQFLPEA
jgi:hypothetical protein